MDMTILIFMCLVAQTILSILIVIDLFHQGYDSDSDTDTDTYMDYSNNNKRE